MGDKNEQERQKNSRERVMRVQFNAVLKDVTRKGTKIQTDEYLTEGKFPIIDQGNNDIAGYRDDETGLFTDVPAIVFGDHTRIVKYITEPFFLGADGVKVLVPIDRTMNCKYLYYQLLSAKIPDTGYNRHFKWVKELEFQLPSRNEQDDVVKRLDKLCVVISARQQQLAKLDELVKARFVEMFGDPVSNPYGFEEVPLSELAEIKIGPFGSLLHKEDYIEGGHPLLNPSHIVDGNIVPDKKLTISDEKYNELEAYHLHFGDVVMGRRGEMGRCAVVMGEGFLCGTGSLLIRTRGEVTADFIQKVISFPSFKKTIEDMAVGQTMPNLNVPIVSRFQVVKPPIDIQHRYYSFVGEVDNLKQSVQKNLDKLETLKKALMQQYFG